MFPLPVSVQAEISIENQLSLFPVPTDGMIDVTLPSEFVSGSCINVIDNIGRIVFTCTSSGPVTTLDLNDLANGCYLIRVTNRTGVLTQWFVKQ
ncbi:MAG: T9SS type A sorting domain-containing protein [Flavobacteriales bacterium]|nr:T9SS type A sorting domain-containing protein [Flavobacteriales bacterium]